MAPEHRRGAVSTSLAGGVRSEHARTLPAPLVRYNLHMAAHRLVPGGGKAGAEAGEMMLGSRFRCPRVSAAPRSWSTRSHHCRALPCSMNWLKRRGATRLLYVGRNTPVAAQWTPSVVSVPHPWHRVPHDRSALGSPLPSSPCRHGQRHRRRLGLGQRGEIFLHLQAEGHGALRLPPASPRSPPPLPRPGRRCWTTRSVSWSICTKPGVPLAQ